MSRRSLAVGTVLLSMALVVIHDLPAAASTVPQAEPVVEGQQLLISDATLAASELSAPLETGRDAFTLSYYTPIQWPVNPGSPISSYFGHRSAPCFGCSSEHSGIDLTPGYGTQVHAIADGVVVSRPMSGWGSYVVIQHEVDGQTVYSGYAHLITGSNVPVGTVVKRGDVIGRVGSTGESTGAHLHFSIILGDTFVDPLSWMRTHVTEAFAG
jgi:murein DD-endopeptidase MepM/ murein hydrolase activator NlpD